MGCAKPSMATIDSIQQRRFHGQFTYAMKSARHAVNTVSHYASQRQKDRHCETGYTKHNVSKQRLSLRRDLRTDSVYRWSRFF